MSVKVLKKGNLKLKFFRKEESKETNEKHMNKFKGNVAN